MQPEMLRVEEAARLLRLGRSKTYQLIKSRELPSVSFGTRSVRVPLSALREWVKEQASASVTAGESDGR